MTTALLPHFHHCVAYVSLTATYKVCSGTASSRPWRCLALLHRLPGDESIFRGPTSVNIIADTSELQRGQACLKASNFFECSGR